MYSIQLTHPFELLVSGSTKSGKTTFVKKLLSYVNVMIDIPPENIVYFYAEYQDTFGEIQNLVPGIKFVQGLPQRRNEGLPTMHCISLLFTITIFNEHLAKSC